MIFWLDGKNSVEKNEKWIVIPKFELTFNKWLSNQNESDLRCSLQAFRYHEWIK